MTEQKAKDLYKELQFTLKIQHDSSARVKAIVEELEIAIPIGSSFAGIRNDGHNSEIVFWKGAFFALASKLADRKRKPMMDEALAPFKNTVTRSYFKMGG
jgi:hypothetical protein